MGHIRHHAIIVTSWNETLLRKAYKMAGKIFDWVSEISPEAITGYRSFFVPPDGSKEGWPDSEAGNLRRDEFVCWLDEQRHEDGYSDLNWAGIQYGDDDYQTAIVRDSDAVMRESSDREAG